MSLDNDLWEAKRHMLKILSSANGNDFRPDELAQAIDYLNKSWDAFTESLIRQRGERDRVILQLIDELAEARKK